MITEFLKPKNLAEAVHLKQANPDALFMGGGSWINSSRSNIQVETVISLADLGLGTIRDEEDAVVIGASATLQEILDNPFVLQGLKEGIAFFYNRNIRNQGTLAGMIAAKQPAFTALTTLAAMGAEAELADKRIPVEEYIVASGTPLILSIRIPKGGAVKTARHSITARGVSLISAAAAVKDGAVRLFLAQDGGKIERLAAVEAQLNAHALPARGELAKMISDAVDSFNDYRTSAAFKKYTAGILLADCLTAATKGE